MHNTYTYGIDIGGKELYQLERFFRRIQREHACTVIGTLVYPTALSIQFQTESKLDQDAIIKRAFRNGINLGITEVAPIA